VLIVLNIAQSLRIRKPECHISSRGQSKLTIAFIFHLLVNILINLKLFEFWSSLMTMINLTFLAKLIAAIPTILRLIIKMFSPITNTSPTMI
jgi:hypothetical protein